MIVHRTVDLLSGVPASSPIYFTADDATNAHLTAVGARVALLCELNQRDLWLFQDATGKLVAVQDWGILIQKAHLTQYERPLTRARYL